MASPVAGWGAGSKNEEALSSSVGISKKSSNKRELCVIISKTYCDPKEKCEQEQKGGE